MLREGPSRDSQGGMSDKNKKPIIGVPVNHTPATESMSALFMTAEKYARASMEISDTAPILIPAFGEATDIGSMLDLIDGLLLTGGRANVEPHHFGGKAFPDDEIIDPERDKTVLPLVRGCVERGIPVFGICRGIQEINVAMGGTLHYRAHLLPGRNDHRMRQDTELQEERFEPRHAISLTPNGYLHKLLGKTETMVNSLHAQCVDRVADGFVVEAMSPDDIIEAINMPSAARFTVGVQWHAEWKAQDHELARKLFEAFGDAAYDHAKNK
ncbi:MAG: hypothetical protein CMM52_16720 [Rhodospirillaceae bacterium]|nr:hypothetical protein [Rhodospirillaceae bacterium]|tara:strand:- start:52902 stop:53711 length:810 start_codon:yes stop_codon:yes gene_type:complete